MMEELYGVNAADDAAEYTNPIAWPEELQKDGVYFS